MKSVNLDSYASKVEAILINPPWNGPSSDKKRPGSVSFDEFSKLNFSKSLMVDGLVFIWVDKELIAKVIKYFETQDMQYVENVCWVMLDEPKAQSMIKTRNLHAEKDAQTIPN